MSKWVLNASDEHAVASGCRFDEGAAERVAEFFRRYLRHSKGEWAGKPFELLDWQRDGIVYPLFGWRRADGTRRFRRAYIGIAKKNGKSTLCSGIAAYLLVGDGEPGAEVYSAAADRDQAAIVFNETANMVEASPELSALLTVNRSTKRVICWETQSYYKALSAEAPTKEGLNIHGLIFDELHAQKTRTLWDTLTYGGAARRQPLLIAITTAGYDRDSICFEQYEYAGKVLAGTIEDDSFFGYIAEAGKDDDWTDEATWRKANPSYAITIKADQFAEDCRQAKESPAKENAFRRYRLNQWTEQETRWLTMEAWDRCNAAVDEEDVRGCECVAGLDLGISRDLTALVLVFVKGERHLWMPFLWMPEENVGERERKDRVPYRDWVRRGLIETTPGNRTDYDCIRRRLNELGGQYRIREIAFDPYNATQLCNNLMDDGFSMVEFRQGFLSMSPAAKATEELVLAGRIAHGGHPVLRWMASNAVVKTDPAGNIKPCKPDPNSGKRIDALVAGIMAEGRMIENPQTQSIYERQGIEHL